jgi:hypothetical protein
MTRDREIAQAISGGINAIAAIVVVLRAAASAPKDPDPTWVTLLDEMARAFDATMANEVWTSMVVREEDRDRVRRLRVLVSDWVTTHEAPDELRAMAESVLKSLGITL